MKTNILIMMLLLTTLAQAQLSSKEKLESLEQLSALLTQKYIDAEVAEKVDRQLRTYYEQGRYDTLQTGEEFAFQVSRDLKDISGDLHLGLDYAPKDDSVTTEEFDKAAQEDFFEKILRSSGYGISKKEILPGNIGYLEIPLFGPLDKVADTLIAAMDFVAGTDALIIDLRECRGSLDPNTIPFLAGYFFDEPVQLGNFYIRENDQTIQYWSAAWVPGKKYLNKPVYILTSARTFSGGEAFAFQMKKQQRAKLIGNTTRGGAHPTDRIRINDLFAASVPYASTLDPVDGSTWEGVGVSPDIQVKTQLALYEAQLLLLDELQAMAEDGKTEELREILKEHQRNKPQFRKITFRLKGFPDAGKVAVTGSFNSWERNSLLMTRTGNEWVAETEASPGKHTYMFIVDGKWINDPSNPEKEQKGEYQNSVLWVK